MSTTVTSTDQVAPTSEVPGRPPCRGPDLRRFRGTAGRLAIIAVLAGVLEWAVSSGRISPIMLARPSDMVRALVDGLVDGRYFRLLGTTLAETGVAFAGAAVVGTTLGYLLWRRPLLGRAYEPALYAMASAPIVLLYPVLLVVFGRNAVAVTVLGFLAGLLPILITTFQAFQRLDVIYVKVAKVMRLNDRQAFTKVLLPAAMPSVVVGLQLGLTFTLLNVLGMEYLAGIGGIGSEISLSYSRLRSAEMYASLILAIALSVTFLLVLNRLTKAVARR